MAAESHSAREPTRFQRDRNPSICSSSKFQARLARPVPQRRDTSRGVRVGLGSSGFFFVLTRHGRSRADAQETKQMHGLDVPHWTKKNAFICQRATNCQPWQNSSKLPSIWRVPRRATATNAKFANPSNRSEDDRTLTPRTRLLIVLHTSKP